MAWQGGVIPGMVIPVLIPAAYNIFHFHEIFHGELGGDFQWGISWDEDLENSSLFFWKLF